MDVPPRACCSIPATQAVFGAVYGGGRKGDSWGLGVWTGLGCRQARRRLSYSHSPASQLKQQMISFIQQPCLPCEQHKNS